MRRFMLSWTALCFMTVLVPIRVAEEQSCARMPIAEVPGDVILGGLFPVHGGGVGGGVCGGRVQTWGLQTLEAFLFALDTLNAANFTPGIKFGGRAYDTCSQAGVAARNALQFLGERRLNRYGHPCKGSPLHAGLIGPHLSAPAEKVAAIMTSARMPQVSYGATATSLGGHKQYPFFLRTVPPTKIYVQVVADVLQELGWTHVVLVAHTDPEVTDRKSALLLTAAKRNICVSRVFSLDQQLSNIGNVLAELVHIQKTGLHGVVLLAEADATSRLFTELQAAQLVQPALGRMHWLTAMPFQDGPQYHALRDAVRGLITITERGPEVAGFRKYFTGLSLTRNRRNPWFREYLEQTYNCTIGVSCVQRHRELHDLSYTQANYVTHTVAAVYSYAHAIRHAHSFLCANISGMCDALLRISPDRLLAYLKGGSFVNLDNSVVSFDETGEVNNPVYSIQSLQLDGVAYSKKEVGTWSSHGGLEMYTAFKFYAPDGALLPSYPPSTCQGHCTCVNDVNDYSHGVTVPGDVLLLGMFDLHNSGTGVRECGKGLHTSSVQALEALYYALDLVNNNHNILPNVRLGAVVMDTCRNRERALRQLRQLMSGTLKIPSTSGAPLPVSAVVGAGTSDISMAIAKTLAPQKIPQISYASSTMELADKSLYPYFLRTVGSDTKQVRAILDIIQFYEWRYVKLLYSDTAYGTAAAQEFLRLAPEVGVCVATQVQLSSYLTQNAGAMSNIVSYYLTEAFTEAKVVVMFATDHDARAVLEAMRDVLGNRSSDIVWLASDFWGSRQGLLRGVELQAAGALTLEFLSHHITGFMQHFRSLHPTVNSRNPWFEEFWQRRFKCFTSNSLSRLHGQPCSPDVSLINEYLRMSSDVPYVIDAVYTVALSLHKLLLDHCGTNSSGLCPAAQKAMPQLYDYMKNVQFYNSVTNLTVAYDALGNGLPRYRLLNLQGQEGAFDYHTVGEWHQGSLRIDENPIVHYPSDTSPVPASAVRSQCPVGRCLCSDLHVAGLQYELRYARLTLLGYFPLHRKPDSGPPCSEFLTWAGFVPLMAFKYAIERVNNDPSLLPNVTLGYMVFDTCSDADYAGLGFHALDKNLRFFAQPPDLPVITYVHAFIGEIGDDVTKELNRASDSGQRLVQISPGSISDDLSNPEDYFYFLRTVAPESNQARALVAILRALGWTYLSIFHTTSSRDQDLVARLEMLIARKGACLATKQSVISGSRNLTEYELAVSALAAQEGAVGVLVVAPPAESRLLLLAVRSQALEGRFLWLAADQWSDDLGFLAGLEDVVQGAITLTPASGLDPYFDAYMRRLHPDQDDGDSPWVREFWQDYFRCDLGYGAGYPRVCDGSESLRNSTFSAHSLAINTINAVYAYAYGLTQLFQERCGGMIMPPCDAITGETRTSTLVYDYIKKARFTGADGTPFRFTEDGNGVGRYRVLHYKVPGSGGNQTSRRAGFVIVGEWASDRLRLDKHRLSSGSRRGTGLRSQCPHTCNCSTAAVWLNEVVPPLRMHAHETVWGILVITFSLLGSVLSVVVIVFFLLRFKHPVVVGATSSLSLLLLCGLLLMYLSTVSFMLTDTPYTCAARRLTLPTAHALVFAVLLVKVVRLSRLSQRPGGGSQSTCSHSALAAGLALVQVVVTTEWLITQPPEVFWAMENTSTSSRHNSRRFRWRCQHSKGSLIASMWFTFILMLATFLLSICARHVKMHQHEALWTLVASTVTMLITVAWTCVYMLADDMYSAAAVAVGITANASVILAALHMTKMLTLTDPRGICGAEDHYSEPRRVRPRPNHHSAPRGGRTNPTFSMDAPSNSYDPYCGINMATFDR